MAASTPPRETLSAVDAAWLRMDRPTNLMMICGLIMLDGAVGLAQLRALLAARMLPLHRFRQRVADGAGDPCWEADPDFDLDWHVRRLALPAGEGALQEVVADLISTALDPHKPMWQFHLIEAPGAAALLMRIHHCYGDGFAMLHLAEAITDAAADSPVGTGADLAHAARRSAWERVLGAAAGGAGDVWRVLAAGAGAGLALLEERGAAQAALQAGADLLRQSAVIAAMTPDAPSRLKGELGVMKKVAWAAPLALDEVKAVAGVLGCSVNDVLVACVAGALRAYLRARGDDTDGPALRALVPVNLRPPGPLAELGNRFGLVFLDLPIDIGEPVACVLEVHRRMRLLKRSKQPQVALAILAALGMAPGFLRERVLEALAANASAVVTNVRGPDAPRYLAGRRIVRQMFWVPQSGGIGLGVSLFSYAGQVSFGVAADARRVPDPEALPPLFAGCFRALRDGALMLPWPGQPGALAP